MKKHKYDLHKTRFMKEVVYGFSDDERHLSDNVGTITYVIKESNEKSEENG